MCVRHGATIRQGFKTKAHLSWSRICYSGHNTQLPMSLCANPYELSNLMNVNHSSLRALRLYTWKSNSAGSSDRLKPGVEWMLDWEEEREEQFECIVERYGNARRSRVLRGVEVVFVVLEVRWVRPHFMRARIYPLPRCDCGPPAHVLIQLLRESHEEDKRMFACILSPPWTTDISAPYWFE